MSFSSAQLNELANAAIEATTQAGTLIAERTGSDLNVALKSDKEDRAAQVLTEVDGLSQATILEILEPTIKQCDLGLLAEESNDDQSRFEKKAFWCIDPLDGTLPFIEGDPGYAVSIALVSRDGQPLIGVVYEPSSKTLYHAIHDAGTYKNRESWKPLAEQAESLSAFLFLNDRSFASDSRCEATLDAFELFSRDSGCPGLETRFVGGAAMNAIWALENPPACYFKFPKPNGGGSVWDYAATACIYHEVGAIAIDLQGNPFELNRPDSTLMNHRGVIFATDQEIAAFIRGLDRTS